MGFLSFFQSIKFVKRITNAIYSEPGFELGHFFGWSDRELIVHLHAEYPDELKRLTRAYSIRPPEDDASDTLESPSQIIFDSNFDEVNRTLVGILALRWLYQEDYETFVRNQPESVKLTRDSFFWLRQVIMQGIQTPQDLYGLVMSMIVNDLGKDPQLASDYRDRTDEDVAHLNHDMILLKAIQAGLIPCLERLSSARRADIIKGMELGAEFNFGQLAQAEAAPACLASLLSMSGHQRAFDFRFREQLLDIAGAAGHMDWTCAKKLIQPICLAYRDVHDASMGMVSGEYSISQAYDLILERRAQRLSKKGFRLLTITQKVDRALARLLCMGGVADLETAQLYEAAWNSLGHSAKESLVCSLNVEGSVAEPAMQPTYMPALLTQGLAVATSQNKSEPKKTVQVMLEYLARVMEMPDSPKTSVIIWERNLLHVVNEVILGPNFGTEPASLLDAAIPKAEIAKTG